MEIPPGIISSVGYSLLGILLSLFTYLVIDMVTPGNLRKQISDDKNMALAIIVGAALLGNAIIIAAAIHG